MLKDSQNKRDLIDCQNEWCRSMVRISDDRVSNCRTTHRKRLIVGYYFVTVVGWLARSLADMYILTW